MLYDEKKERILFTWLEITISSAQPCYWELVFEEQNDLFSVLCTRCIKSPFFELMIGLINVTTI